MAAGLGARDTLRLEAAMPLYGHELTEQINPFEAGLDFAVNLEGREFPGCEALAKDQTRTGEAGCASAWNSPASGPREHLRNLWRRTADRRSHQRHLFADAGKTDRDGLRALTVRRAGNEVGNRHPRHARAGPRRDAAVLPTSEINVRGNTRPEEFDRETRRTVVRQNARMGPRRKRRRRESGDRRHLGVRRRGADRPGVHASCPRSAEK